MDQLLFSNFRKLNIFIFVIALALIYIANLFCKYISLRLAFNNIINLDVPWISIHRNWVFTIGYGQKMRIFMPLKPSYTYNIFLWGGLIFNLFRTNVLFIFFTNLTKNLVVFFWLAIHFIFFPIKLLFILATTKYYFAIIFKINYYIIMAFNFMFISLSMESFEKN